jgi:hypothetical protein
MKKSNKRWLFKFVIAALFSSVIISPLLGKNSVKVHAATDIPVLAGDAIGWDEYSATYTFTETEVGSDIYTLTTIMEAGRYQLIKQGVPYPHARFDAKGYDPENSNAWDYVVSFGYDDFGICYPGKITITMYNPDKNPLSTAGDYRFTVDYDAASFPLGGTSGYIAVGSALDGWDDPKFSEPTNRLVSIDGFDGRYMALTDSFVAGDFKIYLYKTKLGGFGYSYMDLDKSTAGAVLSKGGRLNESEDFNITVNTAGTYQIVFDMQAKCFYFHNDGTTYKTVTKYLGTEVIDKEMAVDGLTYEPCYIRRANHRFAGWFTDPELTIAYVPGLLTADLTLYGKYVESQDTTLIFYDPNHTLSSGDVYLYSWDGDGREGNGSWPGAATADHGYGYYSWFFPAECLMEYVIFNNGLPGADNVKTADLVWEIGKNVYHQETGTWTFVSEVHHKATVFGIKILQKTATCDATGSANNLNAPEWNETLANQYNDSLDPTTKAYLKTAVANPNGDLLAQAMARYDYIVKKYGAATFNNFLDRTIPASGAQLINNEGTDNILVMGAFIVMALVALAGFKLISKKHRYH